MNVVYSAKIYCLFIVFLHHFVGFYHEQSRPDRDMNVRIFHQNIRKGIYFSYDILDKQSSN